MLKILVADDESIIREGLMAMIAAWDQNKEFTLEFAVHGGDALDKIKKEAPAVLITDIRMPVMTGIELLTEIRRQGLDTKVIVLSGYDDFEYVRAMALLGIENYLLKPVNMEELYATLENVLKKIKKECEARKKARMDGNIIRENIINRWIYRTISEDELEDRADFLQLCLEKTYYQPCSIKLLGNDVKQNDRQQLYELYMELTKDTDFCYLAMNYSGDSIMVVCFDEEERGRIQDFIGALLEKAEKELNVKPYLILGEPIEYYWEVAESFRKAMTAGVYLNSLKESREQKKEMNPISPLSERMVNYILQHYDEDLSLKVLARQFGGNAAYIGQTFRKDTGKVFTEYLKEVRIEKAKELLKYGQLPVKEIAEKVGFQTHAYFCTVFRNETGISPAEYRKYFHA